MQCNCKAEIEHRVLEKMAKDHPEWIEPQSELMGYGITLNGNSAQLRFMAQIRIPHKKRFKNGNTKRTNAVIDVASTYCPFCGKKAVSDDCDAKNEKPGNAPTFPSQVKKSGK